MTQDSSPTIESVLHEVRQFAPPPELAADARIGSMAAYEALAARALADPEAFWGEAARAELHWFEPFTSVLDWRDPPFARWFEGGTTNLSHNCLDRHLDGPRAEKTALIWEGEPGDVRTFTYRQLHGEVCRAANALKSLGIGKGDLVALYMPMVPEAAIAMLACARIGAPHSVVFGGFSAEALRDRLIDGQAKLVITADGGFRKDRAVALKPAVDQALAEGCPSVEHVLVVRRTGEAQQHRGRPRPLVARAGGWPEQRLPGRGDGQRGPALRALHLRLHRQAQGGGAHHRGLQPLGPPHLPVDLRHPRGRHPLVHRRCGLDHRPQLHRLRPPLQRRHHRDVRGGPARLQPRGVLGGDPEARRHDLLHGAHGDPRLHEERLARCPTATTCPACGSSAPWGNRSIQRPGCGTGR